LIFYLNSDFLYQKSNKYQQLDSFLLEHCYDVKSSV